MRKAEINGYTYYVTEDGNHFYNSKKKERPIQTNLHRQNRKYIGINGKHFYMNYLVANAFPEICGQVFDGCQVHHIDGNTTNDNANNLIVMPERDHTRLHCGVIVKYSLDGDKVGEYTTSEEAAESINNKRTSAAIRECLCGKSRTCGGFIWKRIMF